MKKIILIGLIIVIIITLKVDVVKAENDVSSSQLGFEISKQDYSQFGYIFNKKINSYYEKNVLELQRIVLHIAEEGEKR